MTDHWSASIQFIENRRSKQEPQPSKSRRLGHPPNRTAKAGPRAGACLLRPIYKFVLKVRKIMHSGQAFFRPSPLFCEAVGVAYGLPQFRGVSRKLSLRSGATTPGRLDEDNHA